MLGTAPLEPGDLLIMGIDGLWDSLLSSEDLLSPQRVAEILGNRLI